MSGIVIIGAGQAGLQIAESLRRGGHTGRIAMLGDETWLPYQRPPLSKEFLKERPAADTLYFRQQKFWDDNHITIDLGIAAKAVDPANRRVTLADGRELDYRVLMLATGTRARDLPLPGVNLPGVFTLRKIDDIRRLRPALDEAKTVAIVGAGRVRKEVVAVDDAPAVHRVVPLSVTFDHRAVTGGEAGRFMGAMIADLQQPD